MKPLIIRILSGAITAIVISGANAQSYTIDRSTIGSGGATTNVGFSVTGTPGQPDAGKLAQAKYSVDGGFWGFVECVDTPGAPAMSFKQAGTNAIISWTAGVSCFVLEQNTDLNQTNGWSIATGPLAITNGQNNVTVPIVGYKYFRLRKP